MSMSAIAPPLDIPVRNRLGETADWYWRGYRIRYRCIRPTRPEPQTIPLLLIHGFGAASGHWRGNLEPLGRERAVYALDLLGFGESDQPFCRYGPRLWSELVHDFWRAHLSRPAVLVGNSLGSVVAMTTAARFPETSAGLIWINLPDVSLQLSDRQVQRQHRFRALSEPLLWLASHPLLIEPILRYARLPRRMQRWLRLAYHPECRDRVDPELVELLSQPAGRRDAGRALRAMTRFVSQVPPRWRARRLLAQLDRPTLLIWGDRDRLVPPQLARPCQHLHPNLQLELLPAMGHCPQDEAPERINPLVEDWVRRLEQSAGTLQ